MLGIMVEGELSKRQQSRVGVSTRMRMVRVHVEDHAAWSEDQTGVGDGQEVSESGWPHGQVGL